MKKTLITVLAVATLALTFGSTIARADVIQAGGAPPKNAVYPQGILFPYSLLDTATAGIVDENGNINYFKLKDNTYLDDFIKAIASADLTQFPTFTVNVTDPQTGKADKTVIDRSAELVFWINSYNACVLYTIAQHYPVKDIDDIKDFDTAQTHLIAGQKYSFEQLRKKIAGFDPRALFALMSGTKGGFLPAKNAYRFTNLNANLDAAVRVFINDPNNVSVNRIENTVTVNEYFKLLNDAFKTKNDRNDWAGIRYLISAYTDNGADQRYLTNSEYQIEFAKASHDINDNGHI